MTPLGILWTLSGDPWLLSRGLYGFLLLLWLSHLAFWMGFLGIVTPLFLVLFSRGGRRPGDTALASLLVGAAGLAFAVWASVRFLHRDLGFFTIGNMSTSLLAFGSMLAAAVLLHRLVRSRQRSFAKIGRLMAVTGLVLSCFLWGTTIWASRGSTTEVDLDPGDAGSGLAAETAAPSGAAAAPAGFPVPASGEGRRRVVLLGLDGADWKLADPLIERGDLPNFGRLRREGAWAPLRTISPFSPVVWTSIATGVEPGRHSVLYFSEMYWRGADMTIPRLNRNFLEPVYSRIFEKIPVSSTTRTSKAIWEIAGTFGLKSLVINWWASFPAEAQEGFNISNYAIPWDEISEEAFRDARDPRGRVYPDEIWPGVVDVMRKSVEGGIRASSFMGTDPNQQITRVDFWDLRDKMVLAFNDRFSRDDNAFTAVYLQGIDTTCHHFSETVFGNNADILRESRVDAKTYEEKWLMVEEAYRRMDGVIGSIMGGMRDDDLLVVVSDHGWRMDGTSHWRMPDGIIALWGAGVRPGRTAQSAHVYDVAPTILWYLGLPLSRELAGRILEEAFDPAVVRAPVTTWVASYGARTQPMRIADPATDAAYRDRLKSLGYVQ